MHINFSGDNSALESDNDVLGQGGLSPAAEKENIIDPKDGKYNFKLI